MKQFCFGASVVMAVKQVVPPVKKPKPSENVAEMRVIGGPPLLAPFERVRRLALLVAPTLVRGSFTAAGPCFNMAGTVVGPGAGVAVAVGVLTAVFVGVRVGVLVSVLVAVLVGVLVAVFVGVRVPVLVGVLVAVLVRVPFAVGVLVGVPFGVGVRVGVRDAVGVPLAGFFMNTVSIAKSEQSP
jgi:hypothetical protein